MSQTAPYRSVVAAPSHAGLFFKVKNSDLYDDPNFDPPLTKPYRELWQCSSRQHLFERPVRLVVDWGSLDPGVSDNSPKQSNDKHQQYIKELIIKLKSYNRSPPPAYIHVPQPERPIPWVNLALHLESTMASHDGSQHEGRRTSREERRASLYNKMITQHENAIDDSDDDAQDEGGMPAWLLKRQSLYHPEPCIPSGIGDPTRSSTPLLNSRSRSPENTVNINIKHTLETCEKQELMKPTRGLSVQTAQSPERITVTHIEDSGNGNNGGASGK